MDSIEIKIKIPKVDTDTLYQFLDSLSCLGHYETLFDTIDNENEFLSDNTKVCVYFHPNDKEKILALDVFLDAFIPNAKIIHKTVLQKKDYEEAYKEFYKPFKIGKFWIVPTWEKETFPYKEPQVDSIPIFLNPGMAFGTGHHETTQMILEILPTACKPSYQVLDLGTGSGILSIACSLLGASSIHAIDIDPNAVRAAMENWQQNQLVSNFVCKICGLDEWNIEHRYDLVLANITFAVLYNHLPFMSKLQTTDFIFSGIIVEKKEEFLNALKEKIPGSVVQILERNGWICLHWRRK